MGKSIQSFDFLPQLLQHRCKSSILGAQVADKFVEHLNQLYQVYAPDMENLPTTDQVLSGLLKPPNNLTFDQQYQFGINVVKALAEDWIKYGKKNNVVFDSRAEEFFLFLETIPFELSVLLLNMATRQYRLKFSTLSNSILDRFETTLCALEKK